MSVVRGVAFEDFDPNNPGNCGSLWSIWTGTQFKTFSTRAAALNGFAAWHRVKLYEYVPGQGWVEHACKNPNNVDDICDRCGIGGVRDTYGPWGTMGAAFQWERHHGRITSPPKLLHVCKPCSVVVRNG